MGGNLNGDQGQCSNSLLYYQMVPRYEHGHAMVLTWAWLKLKNNDVKLYFKRGNDYNNDLTMILSAVIGQKHELDWMLN